MTTPQAKKITLGTFTERHKDWRKLNADSVLIKDSNEEISFYWLYPHGVDIALLSSMADEKELAKMQSGTAKQNAKAANMILQNYDKVGNFLISVLCNEQSELLYDSLEDFSEAGFGSFETIPVYLEIFGKITAQLQVVKKKPNKKK